MPVTYRDVFGADPGQPITGAMNYRPCPAVRALKQLLSRGIAPRHLGGSGGPINEFNRHHAGLAVDIMLDPANQQLVTFGQNLVKFFLSQRQTLKWRGIIYQHVAINTQGPAFQTVTVAGWTQSDHMNHIHIDWFRSSMVTWIHLTEIPVVSGGVTTIIAPKERNRIASVIDWPPEAQTDFSDETGVQSGLAALMAQRDAGALTAVDMTAEASQYVAASTRQSRLRVFPTEPLLNQLRSLERIEHMHSVAQAARHLGYSAGTEGKKLQTCIPCGDTARRDATGAPTQEPE